MESKRGRETPRNPLILLVEPPTADSNQLLETLAEWNTVLENCEAPYRDFSPS